MTNVHKFFYQLVIDCFILDETILSSFQWNKVNMLNFKKMLAVSILLPFSLMAKAEEIGYVDTVFKFFGANHKIVIEAFDDPEVKNVTCYLSRAKTGGISGSLGLAEDTADAAISCQQVGPIELSEKVIKGKNRGDVVFQKRTSLVFKSFKLCVFMIKSVMH
ncbi:protein CreA [Proteus penneri ATCC 35198]|nr:protein CreA [Proteus penneri ATCC 35198]